MNVIYFYVRIMGFVLIVWGCICVIVVKGGKMKIVKKVCKLINNKY